jgi:hypothetical protein
LVGEIKQVKFLDEQVAIVIAVRAIKFRCSIEAILPLLEGY